ncbi:cardiolipin synthase [Neobacillus sp. PS3-12]|uniref:cardiolipin synthase n=1 Tax=Neobacillus sp. PS3-12 TaxID=3070677 RepID=UPI0027E1E01C|nr:cardiolipin synthase [Neobacillus sp. PS3-12]WML55313.1 cardiolipin synthase [Neobacillus sp. PS3-12]
MKVLLGIIIIILIWIFCDFLLGRKKHMRIARKEESTFLYGSLDIFPHGPELMADFFNELKQAKAHIHVLFYIVKKDQISKEFLSILKKKAQEGVQVRLLLSRLGSHKVSRDTISALKEAGVEFAFSNRLRFPFLFYSSQVRNHRKITIIDGTIAYLGGFNVAKEYVDQDPKLSPWRDYHLKISGESVPFIQRVFLKDWKEYGGVDLLGDDALFSKNAPGDFLHQLIPTEAGQLEEIFVERIKAAKTSILIGTPYFIPSKRVFATLLEAIHRGVRLRVIVPAKSDHILVQEASFPYLRRLLIAGAEVFEFKNGFYHAKTCIFDEKICDIGTANFDKRSIFLNKEINCYIHDPKYISRVEDIINKDLLDSKPLLLADLTKPNFFRSFKESIAGAISLFL